jgi:hypothetical protein
VAKAEATKHKVASLEVKVSKLDEAISFFTDGSQDA